MSIRLLARDLYHTICRISDVEGQIRSAPAEQKEALRDTLRRLKAEKNRLRRALDGSKEGPTGRNR